MPDDIFNFVNRDSFNDIFKETTGGFEPLPKEQVCNNPGHNVPMHLCVPANQQYRHVCPACGYTVLIGGNAITFQ